MQILCLDRIHHHYFIITIIITSSSISKVFMHQGYTKPYNVIFPEGKYPRVPQIFSS